MATTHQHGRHKHNQPVLHTSSVSTVSTSKATLPLSRCHKLLTKLASISDTSVDQALILAFPTATSTYLSSIATLLMDRGYPPAMAALIEHFDRLPLSLQEQLVGRVPQLYTALRKAANQPTGPNAVHTIQIIQRAKEGRLAYLLAEQLRHRPKDIQKQAVDALLDLTIHATTQTDGKPPNHDELTSLSNDHQSHSVPTTNIKTTPNQNNRDLIDADAQCPPRCDTIAAQYITAAVEEAVELYELHGQPAALEALVRLSARPIHKTLKRLEDAHHPATADLQRLISSQMNNTTAPALLVMIRVETMMSAALEGILLARKQGRLCEALTHWHFLLDPRTTRPLERTHTAALLWPDNLESTLSDWPVIPSRGLAHWAMSLGHDSIHRVQRLAALRHLPDPMARLSAIRALLSMTGSSDPAAANPTLALFCDDPDPRLARIALRHLIRVQWTNLGNLLTRLVKSPHPDIARLAGQQLAKDGFRKLWNNWPRLNATNRLAVGRALVKIEPRFFAQITERLNWPDRASRLRAISMVQTFNQTQTYEKQLLDAAKDHDEVVASAAVRALRIPTQQIATTHHQTHTANNTNRRNTLSTALRHRDSRVRANAVETTPATPRVSDARLIVHMALDEHNRVRANAIGMLIAQHQYKALELLQRMLTDPRPDHRTSALWLVSTMGLAQVAHTVAEMSISDPDRQVRAKANSVIRHLIKLMHTPPDLTSAITPNLTPEVNLDSPPDVSPEVSLKSVAA